MVNEFWVEIFFEGAGGNDVAGSEEVAPISQRLEAGKNLGFGLGGRVCPVCCFHEPSGDFDGTLGDFEALTCRDKHPQHTTVVGGLWR